VGHDSGVLSDEPCTVLVIALEDSTTHRRCRIVAELATAAD